MIASLSASSNPPYRVVVAVQPQLFNDLITHVLQQDPDFQVVGQAKRLSILLRMIEERQANCALVPLTKDNQLSPALLQHVNDASPITLIGVSQDARTIQWLQKQSGPCNASLTDLLGLMRNALSPSLATA